MEGPPKGGCSQGDLHASLSTESYHQRKARKTGEFSTQYHIMLHPTWVSRLHTQPATKSYAVHASKNPQKLCLCKKLGSPLSVHVGLFG